eukprot:gene29691-5108_t
MARRGEDEEEASPLLPSLADQVQAPAEQEVSSDGTPDTSGNQMKQCRLKGFAQPYAINVNVNQGVYAAQEEDTLDNPLISPICFEDEDTPDNPLISPCKCRGHSRFIHRECLAKWRSSALQNPRNQAAFRCEVCHYKYRFVRSQAAGVVGHPLFVTTVFLLLLLLSFYVCGFIPLVQLCLKSFSIDFSHITLLVHMLDGVLVVGLLGMLGLALDMCTGGSRRLLRGDGHGGGSWSDVSGGGGFGSGNGFGDAMVSEQGEWGQ